MATFTYVAEPENGSSTSGTLEADDAQAVQSQVEAMFDGPVKVTVTTSSPAQPSARAPDDLSFSNASCGST